MAREDLLHEHGIRSDAIEDLDRKKEQVVEALRASGVDKDELAAVTVLALIERVPEKPKGEIVAPVDGRHVNLVRRNVDRGVELNIAATAMMGAAL